MGPINSAQDPLKKLKCAFQKKREDADAQTQRLSSISKSDT